MRCANSQWSDLPLRWGDGVDSTTVDADHYRKRGLDWLKLVSIWLDITRLVIVLEFESLGGNLYLYLEWKPSHGLN